MKALLLILLLGAVCTNQRSSDPIKIRCVLRMDKEVYKVGELPKLEVMIYNDTKDDVYLIGSLDGSDVKWRYPYCYYTIERPGPGKTNMQRCGNMNTLRVEDFRLVKAGQAFNPYKSIDNYGFFSDYTTTNPATFKTPGTYKIKFHYSTNAQSIKEFMGDRPYHRDYSDSVKIDSLFKATPKIELTSNEVVFKIEK